MKRAAQAQLNFQAHDEIQREDYVVSSRKGERFVKSLQQRKWACRPQSPDKKSACQHADSDLNFESQQHDDYRQRDCQKQKYIQDKTSLFRFVAAAVEQCQNVRRILIRLREHCLRGLCQDAVLDVARNFNRHISIANHRFRSLVVRE